MFSQLDQYNSDRFNALADVEVADRERKANGSLERAMSLVAPIFVKYGMCDKWALTLLHNHWWVSETEVPLQETTISSTPMEMRSAPRAVDVLPSFWPMTLAVADDGMRLEPIEFTTDPQAAVSNSALDERPAFAVEISEVLRASNLTETFGLIVPKLNSSPDLEFVEFNDGERLSILREIPSIDADRRNLIETSWRVMPLDVDKKCEKSCFSRCIKSGSSHSHDHPKAHKPG